MASRDLAGQIDDRAHLTGGRRVVVIEDVVTSGGQAIDREAGGRENLARAGMTLHAAFTMSERAAAAIG
jgi:orotate phosphoribosyltransferase